MTTEELGHYICGDFEEFVDYCDQVSPTWLIQELNSEKEGIYDGGYSTYLMLNDYFRDIIKESI